MKKKYIIPSIEILKVRIDPVLIGTSGDPVDADSSSQSKIRNVDLSDENMFSSDGN